jgi:magnesium chelatase family protein
MEGVIVEVEVDVSGGLPFFGVVGLPDAAVRNSGFSFPGTRVVAALAPANLKKAGPAYDLPIAVATIIATGQAPAEADGLILLGELGLDGSLRHTPGILPMVAASHENGFSRIVVPEASAKEASLVDGVEILPFANLANSRLISGKKSNRCRYRRRLRTRNISRRK